VGGAPAKLAAEYTKKENGNGRFESFATEPFSARAEQCPLCAESRKRQYREKRNSNRRFHCLSPTGCLFMIPRQCAFGTAVGLYKIDTAFHHQAIWSLHWEPKGCVRLVQLGCIPSNFFNSQISEKVEDMTSKLGKLAFVVAAAGGLSLAALSPAPVEAGAIHWSQGLAAATGDSDALRVRCVRRASNLWSCNDEVRVRSRRDAGGRDSYAYHPCDHANQTARNGSRCGNRAADRRPGGR
jgi:hypothetical protein